MKKIVALLIVFFSCFYIISIVSAENKPPVALWCLDEGVGTTVYDSSGNNHTGTLSGAASWIPEGKENACLFFNGGWAQLPDNIMDYNSSQDFTWMHWFKRDPAEPWSQYNVEIMMSRRRYNNNSDQINAQLTVLKTNGQARLFFGANTTLLSSAYSTTNVVDGEWHHIAAVRDTIAQKYYLYIDGVLEAECIDHGSDMSAVASFRIGQEGQTYGGDYSFNGHMDEVKIFDCAITQEQILLEANIQQQSEIPNLSLEPTNLNVHRSQDIEIAVNISDASGVVGYRVALDLDPSKVTYVDGSATKVGTSTENGWGPLVVNDTRPALAIFTCASATGAIATGPGSLMKFQLHVNDTLADFTPISVNFTPLTSLNEDAIAFSTDIWSATVLGPNHIPTFTGGANEVVLEDSGVHEIIGWATDISPGISYESWQDLNFTLDIDNASLFFVQPTIDPSGTLRYTLATDEYGICNATAVLHDSGGTANGGIDSSTPYAFSIEALPVNDAPSFIVGATAVVLNATGGQHEFPGWATDISAGPANESTQWLWFGVNVSNPELFSVTPTIDAGGTLRFTPEVDAHGVIDATVTLYDSGGFTNGGIDHSPSQPFVIKIYIPFMWGDLNDNAQAGSVDASLLLQYDAWLISSFPGYPVLDYPEYYPDPSQPWLNFPIAADVNDDDVAGTLDASLILQKYAYLIDWFPADTNQDQWGPDAPLPAGKVSKRQTTRNMNVLFDKHDGSRVVTFQIDDADNVQGLRVDLSYDPEQFQFNGAASGWLVPSGLLAVNDSEPGRLILSGALGTPLQAGKSNLMLVKFDLVGNLTEPLLIQVDEQQTLVNDGQIRINLNYPE